MLTIKQFSRITAIPESTPRYYEQEGVFHPASRRLCQWHMGQS
ncbi:MAG: MerR family transcriptional regulator [Bacillota bacterium]